MSDLRIAVVGTGLMGADHVLRIRDRIAGAVVSAVIDPDTSRAEAAAADAPGARCFSSLADAIAADAMDAVLIATPGKFHQPDLLAVIEAGLPTLCEKPLTPDAASALEVVQAEAAAGRKLIQVGFMRRYDAGYMELREMIADGGMGDLLALRCAHRNPDVPDSYTQQMLINDSVVHEFDIVRYLTDSPVTSVEVKHLKRNPNNAAHLDEPILVLLETASGVVADVEMNVSVRFGYQVKTEAVFADGIAEIGRTSGTTVWRDGRFSGAEHTTFKTRFAPAFEHEIQSWVNAAKTGTIDGPTAWDGYLVAAACAAGVRALETGERVEVDYADRPAFYA
ncbi:Gfo/Idh/MocA family protein [Nocardioides bruguierae]|uniref:Gfo/Idh/MocA family protein n=1 Tax=Nocardioides bruguierae TaxID=2945102 RepID=UPI00202064BC|nr:Gfo/Idh/MocA family oxidoreductase [Nocardioides bruguierae]MCL8024466.1 Gfo/Idh/MocA family oxidoreductase [Nocardioides bruguierae]